MGRLGLPVTYDEIQEEAGGMGAGRPHIAKILVRKGVVGSIQEAFDVWLAKGRPADAVASASSEAMENIVETLSIALKCPPKPDPACLKRIGDQLKADHYVWGTMAGFGRIIRTDQRQSHQPHEQGQSKHQRSIHLRSS